MTTSVRATAPVRVDLAGGTLDLWPLSMLLPAATTVNVAIGLRAGCEIELGGATWNLRVRGGEELVLGSLPERPEHGVPGRFQLAAVMLAHFGIGPCRVTTWSEAAPGSGLGGSSSLAMALLAACAALVGRRFADAEAVSLATNLETRVLGLPAGSQDHWAAWRGGLSVLRYAPEGVVRTACDEALGMAECLVVADTRVQHHSGMNNWAILRAALDGDARVREGLEEIGRAAEDMARAVTGGLALETRLGLARAALRREWTARRTLAPEVTSPEVEALVAAAEGLDGAAKVCGAGGGGCVACLPPTRAAREALQRALEAAGGHIVPVRVDRDGVLVDATWRPA